IVPRPASIEDIQARCIGAMINEAALLISEGVAARPGDIDVALIHGYGFPRWLGGPLWYAANQPAQWVSNALEQIAQAEGPGRRRGQFLQFLASIATNHTAKEKLS